MDTTAFVGACVLALGAPFEFTTPLVRVPGQSISNLELLLAGACGAWVVSMALTRRWPSWRTPLTAPGAVFLGAMFVAAMAAPAYRVNAIHMAARLTAAAAVFLMTVTGVSTPDRVRRAMTAAVGSGCAVAVIAVLEYARIPAVLEALRRFRPGLSMVGAQVRAGGPFAYPTIASMHLEIVFALGLGLLLDALDTNRRTIARGAFAALVGIAYAVTLTFTRAGLITLALSLAIAAAARYVRGGADAGVRVVASLAMAIGVVVVMSRSTEALWLRLTSEGQTSWYRADVKAPEVLTLQSGVRQTVPVRVANLGRLAWDSTSDPPFFLSYHWLQADGSRVVRFEGVRTPFTAPVPAGETAALEAVVWAPPQPGQYVLEWDLVQEHRLWFNTEAGASRPAVTAATVRGPARIPGVVPTFPLPRQAVRPGRLTLWHIAAQLWALHPMLGLGPDNFRLTYGAFAGLTGADERTHSNSMYVEMFVGGGLAGGLAFLWLMWRAADSAAGAVRLSVRRGPALAIGASAAVAAVLVHGFVDSFFGFTPAYIVIAFTFGLAVAASHGAVNDANCV